MMLNVSRTGGMSQITSGSPPDASMAASAASAEGAASSLDSTSAQASPL